jgi:hypothetical protein
MSFSPSEETASSDFCFIYESLEICYGLDRPLLGHQVLGRCRLCVGSVGS